jgi:hypothetical protein
MIPIPRIPPLKRILKKVSFWAGEGFADPRPGPIAGGT